MKTEYSSVVFPPGTSVLGRVTRAMSARDGVTLTRITEDGRDDLVITKAGREPWDVPWAQVRGGLRASTGPVAKKARKADPE